MYDNFPIFCIKNKKTISKHSKVKSQKFVLGWRGGGGPKLKGGVKNKGGGVKF